MAISRKRAIKHAEVVGEELFDNLSRQIVLLRKELGAIAEAVNDYSGSTLGDAQHNALALARDMREGGKLVAKRVVRQAGHAGDAVRENPLPVLIGLGTIALLSTFLFSRGHRSAD
ncbi:MAG TPA: hypothetical protein VGB81_06380 [Devosia sp.]|jgi:hypothetical protein